MRDIIFQKKDDKLKKNDITSQKYLLGEMGIQVLKAIFRGGNQIESISMLSGVSLACVKGRIPILIELNLISKFISESGIHGYKIIEKGKKFIESI